MLEVRNLGNLNFEVQKVEIIIKHLSKSNPNDFAPRYAGLVNGLANTFANNTGQLATLFAGLMLDKYADNEKLAWNVLFAFASGLTLFSGLVFYFFIRTDEIDWVRADFTAGKKSRKEKSELE